MEMSIEAIIAIIALVIGLPPSLLVMWKCVQRRRRERDRQGLSSGLARPSPCRPLVTDPETANTRPQCKALDPDAGRISLSMSLFFSALELSSPGQWLFLSARTIKTRIPGCIDDNEREGVE